MGAEPTRFSTPHAANHRTWLSARAWAILLTTLVVALASDLASKRIAFERVAGTPVVIDRHQVLEGGALYRLIPPHEPVVVIPQILEFVLVLNPGAVFGMGPGKRWFFIAFTVAAIGFALWLFATWTKPTDRRAHIGLGLLLGGGLGNLYDRLRFGCVRDFIHPLPRVELPFGWKYPWGFGPTAREVWPYVSNVADLLLIIGIVMLIFHTWSRGSETSVKNAAA